MKWFKRHLLPPLQPALLLVAVCAWTVLGESRGTPRVIQGEPDDGPRFAAVLMIVLSPVFYLGFAAINLLDGAFDKMAGSSRWWMSGVLHLCLAAMLFRVLYLPGVDESKTMSLLYSLAVTGLMLWPMSWLRRKLGGGVRQDQSDQDSSP